MTELTRWIGTNGTRVGEQELDVPLAKGHNDIRIILSNAIGEAPSQRLVLDHEGDGDLDKRGTLYILAIGVDKYPAMGNTCGNRSESCDLRFAGADRRDEVAHTVDAALDETPERTDDGAPQGLIVRCAVQEIVNAH